MNKDRPNREFNYIQRTAGSFEYHEYTTSEDAELVYRDYMASGWFMVNDLTYARRFEAKAPVWPRAHSYSGFAQ